MRSPTAFGIFALLLVGRNSAEPPDSANGSTESRPTSGVKKARDYAPHSKSQGGFGNRALPVFQPALGFFLQPL